MLNVEPNEVRAVRKQLNDWCIHDPSLPSQVRARLICFIDSFASTAMRLAKHRKDESSVEQVEAIDRELAGKVIDLEKRADSLKPQLIERRKTLQGKVDSVLDSKLETVRKSIKCKGDFDVDMSELLKNVNQITDEEASNAEDVAKALNIVMKEVKVSLPSILDKAEMNLAALKSIPLDTSVKDDQPLTKKLDSPSLLSMRKVSESLAKRIRLERGNV